MTAESVPNKEFLLLRLGFRLILHTLIPLAQILHQCFTSSASLLMKLHKGPKKPHWSDLHGEIKRAVLVNCIFLLRGGEITPRHASVTTTSLVMLETLLPLCQFGLQVSLSMSGSREKESATEPSDSAHLRETSTKQVTFKRMLLPSWREIKGSAQTH